MKALPEFWTCTPEIDGDFPCPMVLTRSFILVAVAVFCFHFAYGLSESAFAQLFIVGYAAALVQLT